MQLRVVTLAALPWLAGCSSPPPPAPPDPRVELARHNDEYWAYLDATYDKDGDARIERAEYTRGDDSFAQLDRDHDGVITRADLDRDVVPPPDLFVPFTLIRMAEGPEATSASLDAIRAALLKVDQNGDGRVDRAEFLRASPKGMPGVDRFGTLLAAMDVDHDQLLSLPEIEQWLAHRDADGDGALVLRERTKPGPPPPEGQIAPAAREPAPDFTATSLADGQPVALSKLLAERERKRPLALIFGSFT